MFPQDSTATSQSVNMRTTSDRTFLDRFKECNKCGQMKGLYAFIPDNPNQEDLNKCCLTCTLINGVLPRIVEKFKQAETSAVVARDMVISELKEKYYMTGVDRLIDDGVTVPDDYNAVMDPIKKRLDKKLLSFPKPSSIVSDDWRIPGDGDPNELETDNDVEQAGQVSDDAREEDDEEDQAINKTLAQARSKPLKLKLVGQSAHLSRDVAGAETSNDDELSAATTIRRALKAEYRANKREIATLQARNIVIREEWEDCRTAQREDREKADAVMLG